MEIRAFRDLWCRPSLVAGATTLPGGKHVTGFSVACGSLRIKFPCHRKRWDNQSEGLHPLNPHAAGVSNGARQHCHLERGDVPVWGEMQTAPMIL